MDNYDIKCGKCKSEYKIKKVVSANNAVREDKSCPVCGHGSSYSNDRNESIKYSGKILKD